METETRNTVLTVLLAGAMLILAATGVLLAPEADTAEPSYAPPAACATAVDLGYRMETLHGQVTGSLAALGIATDHGWKQTAAKVQRRIDALQGAYLRLSGERREAAAECLTGRNHGASASL